MVSNCTANPTVMSIIIDGMDQHKCTIPYCGGQKSFGNNALSQHITGVKEHGVNLKLYRTISTVGKSANLTIHCILLKLEEFLDRNHKFPEKLYVQVDGGCENANKYVLGLLELLVIKRICKEVYYTRLPTGHTHEDIDACFGTIWKALREAVSETTDQWDNHITTAFGETTLNAVIEDIWTIPNYEELIGPCIIDGLGRLHRDLRTQHQWRFSAVKRCQFFPFGCKTTFRAYSADAVVEFIRKPPLNCMSNIGRSTGLEATKVYCRWFPSADCSPRTRPGVEGMYILESLPVCATGPSGELFVKSKLLSFFTALCDCVYSWYLTRPCRHS